MLRQHRKKIVFLCVLTAAFIYVYRFFNPTADEVMHEFYTRKEVGSLWIDAPLKCHADTVKMHVIRDITNKDMRYRHYALGFLGDCHIKEALPTLLAMLFDPTETDSFRGDVLEAIFLLAPGLAMDLAVQYADKSDSLGSSAKSIQYGRAPWPEDDNEGDPDDEYGAYCIRRP